MFVFFLPFTRIAFALVRGNNLSPTADKAEWASTTFLSDSLNPFQTVEALTRKCTKASQQRMPPCKTASIPDHVYLDPILSAKRLIRKDSEAEWV